MLLIDKDKCLKNIARMAEKVKTSDIALRPHFKTHHSVAIGSWYRDFGVKSCTVSSVSMAKYFSNAEWNDITIAFPFNPLEASEIAQIALKSKINILIESEESLKLANDLIDCPVNYFIKIDLGTKRTGIAPANTDLIEKLRANSSEKISFAGFLAHAGHTYSSDIEGINQIYQSSVKLLTNLRSKFGGVLSYGDTPSCSIMKDFSAFDEIRAGNFIFYDWMQKEIGSCKIEDISVCLACPVVAIHSERNEIVMYGGGVHLSKDFVEADGKKCFGKAVRLNPDGWETEIIGNVEKLSQEHGIIKMANGLISHIKEGDLIGIIPVHSCLTADLQGHYYLTTGQKIKKIVKE